MRCSVERQECRKYREKTGNCCKAVYCLHHWSTSLLSPYPQLRGWFYANWFVGCRLIIFRARISMRRIRIRRLSRDTCLMRRIINLGGRFICILVVRRVWRVGWVILGLGVSSLALREMKRWFWWFPVIQVLMEATNGLGIILENRYYGGSYPFNSSTTDELAYLTTEQS